MLRNFITFYTESMKAWEQSPSDAKLSWDAIKAHCKVPLEAMLNMKFADPADGKDALEKQFKDIYDDILRHFSTIHDSAY